jgi:anti-sigma factor RsiW
VSCDPERITAYVDGTLDNAAQASVESHLAACDACRAQVEDERAIRAQLKALPPIEPSRSLERQVRRQLRAAAPNPLRFLLPLAAGLALLAFWARGAAPVAAWAISRDHAHCFSLKRLPAQVFSGDFGRVAAWFEEQGTRLPALPSAVGELELVGGRFCPLLDGSKAAHLYYVSDDRHVSIFVLAHGVRLDGGYGVEARGKAVHLTRLGDTVVGVVSERQAEVNAFRAALSTAIVWHTAPAPAY